MPEPGSKKYDVRRAHERKEAERSGAGKHAAEEAAEKLQADPHWRSGGPRTERGRGPKGERPEHAGRTGRNVRGGKGSDGTEDTGNTG
ncbi:hypothetical protein [Streptomyces minutiscleroticus]|uniref:Uncharacterized protein n=1 Tax=Streptomyces minutiscleroticus TaxID=68238 RepID=A0A918NTL1_9ACTN|nr:hypothetical protein [Streptomyces minutiscleroticus]GGX94180.1 hypothetical protein GCM10010358_55040 [Streptomyces minutiscleroticus]